MTQQDGLGTDPEGEPIVRVTVTLDGQPLTVRMVDGSFDQDCRSDPRRAPYARRAWSIASRTSVAAARNCVITASANVSDSGMTS